MNIWRSIEAVPDWELDMWFSADRMFTVPCPVKPDGSPAISAVAAWLAPRADSEAWTLLLQSSMDFMRNQGREIIL